MGSDGWVIVFSNFVKKNSFFSLSISFFIFESKLSKLVLANTCIEKIFKQQPFFEDSVERKIHINKKIIWTRKRLPHPDCHDTRH